LDATAIRVQVLHLSPPELLPMNRQAAYETCLAFLQQRETDLHAAITELSAGAEGKSTAGDKHETAQAMAQLEQEKLAQQLSAVQLQLAQLTRFHNTVSGDAIAAGHLLRTNKGLIYISVPLGRVQIEGQDVMVISPQSPLGVKLIGKKAGEKVVMNGTVFEIEEVL
jgi:transcription elongation GreA/GreB family factor